MQRQKQRKNYVLLKDFCWEKGEREQMKRGARHKNVIVMRLMMIGGESEYTDAGRCFTTPSGTTSARKNKGTRSYRYVGWPEWVSKSEGRGPLAT